MGLRTPLNYDQPGRVPMRPMGRHPVIVRMVWDDDVIEWLPAYAIRWTNTHVMVVFHNPDTGREDDSAWLRASDVLRAARWFVDPGTDGPEPKYTPVGRQR